MAVKRTVVRVEATYGLTVKVGDHVRPGQSLCDAAPATQDSFVCPVPGTIETVRFDPERHEFVITVGPPAEP